MESLYKGTDDDETLTCILLPTSKEYTGSLRRIAEAIRFLADLDDLLVEHNYVSLKQL